MPNIESLVLPTFPALWLIFLISLALSSAQPIWGTSPIAEPYPYVSSGSFNGPAVPLSPDPLVSYRWPSPQASDGLEIYLQIPITVTADTNSSFANLQSLTGTNPAVTVSGTGSIQMDFGRENAAWLEFDSPDLASTNMVEMSISEYNQPEITSIGGAHNVKTLVPTKYGNTYRLELNSQFYEGVRFGWIHVLSFTNQWHITGLRLVCQNKPANYNGSFSCSDPMLTRIWYVGAYTVKLNLLSNYFGAILVDRGDRISWTGDAHCSQAAALVAFGNYDFIKENLINTSNNDNGIASYALYWVLSLTDYYNYTGDAATLAGSITNVEATLDNAYAVFGTYPGLGFYGWDERLGAGFQNASCLESQNAYEMLSIRAWESFAAAMGAYGRTDLQTKYNGYANEKMAVLRQNAAWYQGFGLHACADAINTGLLNATEKNAIYAQEFTNKVNRVSYSPFNQYFVIQAFAALDKYDDALDSINDLWGSEINYGGTTFFELSRPSWNAGLGTNDPVPNAQCGFTSLCHPWSAGVVKWLSEQVLGIQPTSPGFATYQIVPHLGRTLTYVTGTTPTPLGNVQASFNVSNGVCFVSAPAGTVGTIGVPKVEKSINSISINGTPAWDGAFHPVPGIGGATEDSEFVHFTGVQPGTYSMSVSYSGSTPVYNPPAEQYAAQFLAKDSTTSGNWGGVYGKDGYVLCNYNGNGNDKKSLPSYVASVAYNMIYGDGLPNAAQWATGTSDTRALSADSSNSNIRNATCLYTDGYNGGRNTMTFTVSTIGSRTYQVTLYFVDWDNKGRQLAVEMFDANTLNLISPVQVVSNCYGGCYLLYSYNQSAKFRIDQVRGDNAVLSGIFFDSAPATPVTVTNFNFELNVATGSGQLVGSVPSGWTAFNEGAAGDIGSQWAGQLSPGVYDYTTNMPLAAPVAGNQYCYINMFNSSVTGGIYQDAGPLQPNTIYALTVALGSRADRVNSPGIISLVNGTNNTGTVLASGGGLPGAQNGWQNYTATFTTGASVSGDLTVALSVTGNGTTIQADFDNVRLTATPVPMPPPPTPVSNFSFEFDAAAPGTDTGVVPAGWTAFNQGSPGDIGSQNAGSGDYNVNTPLATPADGNQYCYINMLNPGVEGGIYQNTGPLQPNTVYTLTVAIGSRADRTNSPGIISLINGNDNSGTVLARGGGLPATRNNWQDNSISFTTGASATGSLTIVLSALGNATTIQADFDNVRLTKSPLVAPIFGSPKIMGSSLILTGNNGTTGSGYTWLVATNLSAPFHWMTNGTGILDGAGAFSNAIPVNPAQPASFFRLRMP